MTWERRLRRTVLRWDRLAIAVLSVVPTVLMSLLGFLWLAERGWLVPFVVGGVAVGALAAGVRWWARRRPGALAPANPSQSLPSDLAVSPDADWSARETEVFRRVRAGIEARVATPQPWDTLPQLALDVVDEVAKGLGARRALDFTLPEALLLVERAASRYRAHTRQHVPFADTISIGTVQWLWQHRGRIQGAYDLATAAQRVFRVVSNPPVGIGREIERLVTGGNMAWLSDQMIGTSQAVLLEEVAFSAVELYSGRLRFSDAELLELGLAAAKVDRARLAEPDAPLRILLVGQASAGKSTLVNALLGQDRAETDAAPTTPRPTGYEATFDGMPCVLIDSRGIDGTAKGMADLLTEMRDADLILWVVRSNRPARAVDTELLRRFQVSFAAEPDRERPEIVFVASWIDAHLKGWPFPENHLPSEAQEAVGAVVLALAQDLGDAKPIPVCATEPSWNLDEVQGAVTANLGRAIKTQRNRRRLVDAARSSGVLTEIARTGQGAAAGAGLLGGHLLRRLRGRIEAKSGESD